MLFFVQPSFAFSESVYLWSSQTDSCSRQTERINGVDFLALICGNGYQDSDARVWSLSIPKIIFSGRLKTLNSIRNRESLLLSVPEIFIFTYLPHQIIHLDLSIALGSRISASNLPLLNTFSHKRIRYCVKTTCYLPTYWSPPLERRLDFYPQVIPGPAVECYPWRYKPLQRRRHMDLACSGVSKWILGSLIENGLR